MMALASTAVCSHVERITLLESVDLRGYANEPMYRGMGIDRDPADPEAAVLIEQACRSFRDQVAVMANALAVELDEIRFHADFAVANEDLDVGFMTIGRGRVAGIRGTIAGWAGGRARLECRSVWKMGDATTPDWPVEHGYVIEVEGEPSFRCRIEPGKGWSGAGSTSLPVVNAIPAVVRAPAGIVNVGDLPFVARSARCTSSDPSTKETDDPTRRSGAQRPLGDTGVVHALRAMRRWQAVERVAPGCSLSARGVPNQTTEGGYGAAACAATASARATRTTFAPRPGRN